MSHWPAQTLVLLVRSYQLMIGTILGPHCRFHPTCSQYAIKALRTHAVLKGAWPTLLRLGRYHPLHPGRFDPVPPRDSHERAVLHGLKESGR